MRPPSSSHYVRKAKLSPATLSDFEELAIHDTCVTPASTNSASKVATLLIYARGGSLNAAHRGDASRCVPRSVQCRV